MMLIPLILLIILVLTSKENIQQHFSKEILKKLSVGGNTIGKMTRNGLLFITLILFIISLSRPVINEKEQNIQQSLIPIVIALDVSKSMMATDIFPNRISLAKKKLKQIIEISKNSTIGVVLFAKDSFILSPVTEDFISLKYIVDNLDTNLDFVNGSNIYSTLEATKYMLEEFKVKNLIILSDGGNDNEYTKELEYVKENNIDIYSIGLATKKGSPIPDKNGYLTDKNGNIVTVKLNESIKNLSLNSAGGYIDFSLDNQDVIAIIDRINLQSKKEELTTQKIKTYTELFYYPLGLALFVFLIALSSIPTSKHIISFLFLCLFVTLPTNSKAEIFEFKNIEKANKFYDDKSYKKSSDEYRKISSSPQSFYNLGNSLYKEGQYKEAMETYSKVITQNKELEYQKLHNIGNSYVKLNNLEKAKEMYEKALQIREDEETKENLKMVNEELKKQKKKDDKKDQKENDKNKDKDKKSKEDNKKQDSKDKKKESDEKKKEKEKENQKKQNSKDKKDKEKKSKEDKNKNDSKEKGEKKPVKKENISDMEEKKWMDILNNGKAPILLRKVNTNKESNNDENQPW